jgi:riboflavin kinase/FMN adenylyltransferase
MELIRFSLTEEFNLPGIVAAMGHFDGLHLAHRALLERGIAAAKETGTKSAVITFDPHPDYVLKKRPPGGYLTPLAHKQELLAQMGVDYLIVVPFTLEIANLTPAEFSEKVLDRFNIKMIIVGFDYRYGRGGQGDSATLGKKYPVIVVPAETYLGEKIGSVFIRRMLEAGNMAAVRTMLGRYYEIRGRITADPDCALVPEISILNIEISDDYQAVKPGIYAVIASVGIGCFSGVAQYDVSSSGRPTMRLMVHPAHIDFSHNETIAVAFTRYLRAETNHASAEELAAQIRSDLVEAETIKEES